MTAKNSQNVFSDLTLYSAESAKALPCRPEFTMIYPDSELSLVLIDRGLEALSLTD